MDLFKLVREQIHSAPLFTQASTWDPESRRAYGQEQINQRYGVKNKATVDPFLAMPGFSRRFEEAERTLPDLSGRPFCRPSRAPCCRP